MPSVRLTAPDWFVRGAMYQINPRTFSREGTIEAVRKELPFLAELGFGTMYLCPVFEADDSEDRAYWSERQKKSETGNPKNPYRMNDYYAIDSEYGTMDDLKRFVADAHALGMRVMLDLVYLHIGPNAPILKLHPEFAQHNENGTIRMTQWHFPYMNFESEGLREYLWANMIYYIVTADVDGFRCDVADGVPLDFWLEARRRMHAVRPDAVLLSESSNYRHLDEAFDAMYAFDWHETMFRIFRGESTADELAAVWKKAHGMMPKQGLLMRDMDNHDTVTDWPERAEIAGTHDGMELAEAINFAMDGVPMVYCGNEIADESRLSMFANRFHPGRFEVTDREHMTEAGRRRAEVIARLNGLRRTSDALAFGDTELIETSDPGHIFAFVRSADDETVVFMGNLSREAAYVPAELASYTGEVLAERGWGSENDTVLEPYAYRILRI